MNVSTNPSSNLVASMVYVKGSVLKNLNTGSYGSEVGDRSLSTTTILKGYVTFAVLN